MKNTNKKGFTLVELVVVIAVIAILAGVLIATFASVLKRANQSAEVQNIKNAEIAQKADDIIAKIENSNWFGWEEFETEIVTAVAKAVKENNSNAQLNKDEIKSVVEEAVVTALANIKGDNTELTEDQVKAIVENAMGSLKYEGVTEAQVRAIVNGATATLLGNELTAAQVRAIVNAANENNLTAVQLANIMASNLSGVATLDTLNSSISTLQTLITGTTAELASKNDVQDILDAIDNFANNTLTDDLDDVITAKALNIRIKNTGLTSANTPYEVFEAISFDVVPDKSTILLSLGEQFGFFVVDTNNVLVNSCGLNIAVNNNIDKIVVDPYQYWAFVDSITSTGFKYSQYLRGTDKTDPINIDTGLDVGQNTGITAINYESTTGHTVVIRTDGGTLTINASSDTVKHYGSATVVTLTAVSSSSYYEYGKSRLVDIKNGRLVITNAEGAEVGIIYLTATENGYNGIILATQNGSELPKIVAREEVELPETGKKLVVTIQTNVNAEGQNPTKTELIYLYPASDVKEENNGYNVTDLGLLVVEAISSSAKELAEEQLADKGAEVIAKVKENKTDNLEEISTGAKYFAGGKGTEDSPYLISNAEELSNIREALDANYKVINDIDMSSVTTWTPIGTEAIPFSGKLDGCDWAIKNWNNNSKSLFGVIQGTDNEKLTGQREDALDDNNNLVVANVSENNYSCVVKNINILNSELVLKGYMGGIASVVIDAYIENIEVNNCRIRYDSGWYTGIFFGEVFKSYIKELHLASNNVINCAENPSYLGNTGLMIGCISGGTTEEILTKEYLKRSDMHFRTIVDNCTNDATATFIKTSDMGFLGGIVGCIYSRQSDEIIIDCVNNGNIIVNNKASKLSVAAICGVHMGGGKINIIRCTNTGNITVIGNPSLSGSDGYDQISGIASYTNGPYIDCVNSGNLSGNVKYIGGICAKTSSNVSSTFINCSNTGYLFSSNNDAAIAEICGSSSSTFVNVTASEINAGGITAYKIRLTGTSSTSGTLIIPTSAGIIEVVDSTFGFSTIDLSNVNGTVEMRVSNANVSLIGNNPSASISFIGENNIITIDEETILGNIKIEGTNGIITNNGIINHLKIVDTTITSTNNGTMGSVEFVGSENLEMSFVNNGTIGQIGDNYHTVQTQSQVDLTFTNYGKIYGFGQKYALLFYGMSNVVFNAGENSSIVVEDSDYTAIFFNVEAMRANSVTFNIAPYATGTVGDSYYGISSGIIGETQIVVNVDHPLEISVVWTRTMPFERTTTDVGKPYNHFYPNTLDGGHITSSSAPCDSNHQYIITISDTYTDDDNFIIAVIFYNYETGLITEVFNDNHDAYPDGKTLNAGDVWTITPNVSTSNRFFVTGWCCKTKTSSNINEHFDCINRYANNVTITSQLVGSGE